MEHEDNADDAFSPSVCGLTVSPLPMSGYDVVPVVAVFEYCHWQTCKWQWFVETSADDECWTEVATTSTFSPDIQHVSRKIKVRCIPSDGQRVGFPLEAISEDAVAVGPECGGASHRQRLTPCLLMSQRQLRIITYNILLDAYLRRDYETDYRYCPLHVLEESFRQQLIVKELKNYHGDILCLQEVGSQVYINYLQPALRAAGYTGYFTAKVNDFSEGLATFYRTEKLNLLKTSVSIIGDTLLSDDAFTGLRDALQSNHQEILHLVSTLGHVCQVLIFSCGKSSFIVANTHFCWMPGFELVPLIQCHVALHCIDRIRTECGMEDAGIIFCGDLNHEPSSATYRYINEGEIQIPGMLRSGQSKLSHSFSLNNATGTPHYSWLVDHIQQLLDYIYVDSHCFRVQQALPLPTEEELKQDGRFALPSCRFPSDHLALGVDIEVVNV